MFMIKPIAINSSSSFAVVVCAPEFETVVDVVVKVVLTKFGLTINTFFVDSIFSRFENRFENRMFMIQDFVT